MVRIGAVFMSLFEIDFAFQGDNNKIVFFGNVMLHD